MSFVFPLAQLDNEVLVFVSSAMQEVYDRDTFSRDDKMGDAEFDIRPFVEALRMKLHGLPTGTIITRIQPSRGKLPS